MTESSDYDGLPSKVYAILSSGKPIIAATNSDTPLAYLLQKSKNGIVVERGNTIALAGKIEYAYNGGFTEADSIAGRSYVVSNYSKEVITNKYVELLEGIK